VRETPPRIETRERIVVRDVPIERTTVETRDAPPLPAPASASEERTAAAAGATRATKAERVAVTTTRTVTAAAARPAAALPALPMPAEPAAPRERDVHITIGRIDVRAVTPPPRERPRPSAPPALTLDEYLAQRSGR